MCSISLVVFNTTIEFGGPRHGPWFVCLASLLAFVMDIFGGLGLRTVAILRHQAHLHAPCTEMERCLPETIEISDSPLPTNNEKNMSSASHRRMSESMCARRKGGLRRYSWHRRSTTRKLDPNMTGHVRARAQGSQCCACKGCCKGAQEAHGGHGGGSLPESHDGSWDVCVGHGREHGHALEILLCSYRA